MLKYLSHKCVLPDAKELSGNSVYGNSMNSMILCFISKYHIFLVPSQVGIELVWTLHFLHYKQRMWLIFKTWLRICDVNYILITKSWKTCFLEAYHASVHLLFNHICNDIWIFRSPSLHFRLLANYYWWSGITGYIRCYFYIYRTF